MRWLKRRDGSTRCGLAVLCLIACAGGALGARRAFSRSGPIQPAVARGAAGGEPTDAISAARTRLAEFEEQRRRTTDFAHLPPANLTHGPDPYALVRLDAEHFVGVLRGASALVVLDQDLHELARVPVAESVVAVTASGSGDCWAGGERSPWLTRYHFDGSALHAAESRRVPNILGIRALSTGPSGVLYALDVHDGRLLTLRPRAPHEWQVASRSVGHGPISLAPIGPWLVLNVLLDHALVVYSLDGRGEVLGERATIRHDGPIWGFAGVELPGGELALSATGVEDHPLDRGDGAFGYIDSFLFQYLLPRVGAARRLWSVNLSELGVVTPKAPVLRVAGTRAKLFVSGYGSDRAAELAFELGSSSPPQTSVEPFMPGTAAAVELGPGRLGFADPLLDAWLLRREDESGPPTTELRPVAAGPTPLAPSQERLGEALFFTTLMSPAGSSEGKHSRFTCETCHFEGYVDGRVHHTGRGDVRVSTKPLRGLFNNRPHFSRALDPDLATVSHHEFRVAGEGTGADPWFSAHTQDVPWLGALGVTEPVLGPEALRRALLAFLMKFSHTTNPAVVGRRAFDPSERRGAELFRDRCVRCHAARLQSDVPNSAVSFAAWEPAIFSPEGPLVWASAEYEKTGVEPYVHESGARVPSLRRLYTKWPHFTNGSADSVRAVLERVRYDEGRFFHDNAPSDGSLQALSSVGIADLSAFLDLL